MNILIADTASSYCSAALIRCGEPVSESAIKGGKTASALLPAIIQSVIKSSGITTKEIDYYAVTVGPGAFTGLRVGAALIKGMAFASNKPVVPISSLALIALSLPSPSLPVMPLIYAGKGEVYAALYNIESVPQILSAETVIKPSDLDKITTEPFIAVGSGAQSYRKEIEDKFGDVCRFASLSAYPRASAAAEAVIRSIDTGNFYSSAELRLAYIRRPEAEIALEKKNLQFFQSAKPITS